MGWDVRLRIILVKRQADKLEQLGNRVLGKKSSCKFNNQMRF